MLVLSGWNESFQLRRRSVEQTGVRCLTVSIAPNDILALVFMRNGYQKKIHLRNTWEYVEGFLFFFLSYFVGVCMCVCVCMNGPAMPRRCSDVISLLK